jgi:hypothetical protein
MALKAICKIAILMAAPNCCECQTSSNTAVLKTAILNDITKSRKLRGGSSLKPKPILRIGIKSILRIDTKPILRIGIDEHAFAIL